MARPNCPLFPILQANPLFFSPKNDISGCDDNAPRLQVPPIGLLRCCASQGCDLCRVLTAGSTKKCLAADLTPFELEYAPIHLSRAMLSYHQQITLYCGIQDLLPPKHFFRIPSPWSMFTPIIVIPVQSIFIGVFGTLSGLTRKNRGQLATGTLRLDT